MPQKTFTAQGQKYKLIVNEIGYNNSLSYENVWYEYWFNGPEGNIFHERHFYAPLMYDNENVIEAIMGFVTLRPGDTDAEHFDNYTPEQLAFCHSAACEELGGCYGN
jgi:hypothetical protein